MISSPEESRTILISLIFFPYLQLQLPKIRFQNEHAGGFSIGQHVLTLSGIRSQFFGSIALFDALAISFSVKRRSRHLPSTSILVKYSCDLSITGEERVELSSLEINFPKNL
jgi:hypothetical protein